MAMLLIPLYTLAEENGNENNTGSWSQINQSVKKDDNWVRFAEGDEFRLGETVPLEGNDNLYIGSWGTYPSMDGSTVCVPMAMELARQWLDLPEEDLNGFVNFSTTPYAYDRLIKGSANPLVTVRSQGVMMDDTHPIDLVLATYPNADERKAAEDAGVELVYVPFCCDAFIFMVNEENPVKSLTVREIREIYSGKITSWYMVGGTENTIDAYQRPHGSGSQTAMEEMVMNGLAMSAANENYISDGMIDAVQQIGNYNNGYNAIGYSYLYYVDTLVDDGGIKVLAVDGIKPTPKNLQSGKYPFTVNYYAVYRKGDAQTEAFVNWLTGDEGQKAVAAAGYVPLRGAPDDEEDDEDDEDHDEEDDAEEDREYRRTVNGELNIAEGTVTIGVYEGETDDEESDGKRIDPDIQALFDMDSQTMFYGGNNAEDEDAEDEDRNITDVVSKVNWPSSLRIIGTQAFCGVQFDTLTLPASLERIYPDAFTDCSFRTLRIECELPYEQIEELMYGSNNIYAFEVPADHPLLSTMDGVLYTKDGKTLLDYPSAREDTHFAVPEGVEQIADGAFYNENLTSVSLSGDIKTIGEDAFSECKNLMAVSLPTGLKTIGKNAFYECENLMFINLPDGLETIGEYAFYKCKGLEVIQFPEGLKTIGQSAFFGCKGLMSIGLPDGLETIGEWAFTGCENIKTVHFPDSITRIGNAAFESTGLTSVTIPKGVTTIENGAFMFCHDLKEINLHDGITSIEYFAFSLCNNVTSITIPDSVQTIGDNAFEELAITSLNVPGSVQTIGTYAFAGCGKLEEITLQSGIRIIGDRAFSNCGKLEEITIPDSVTSLGNEVFAFCDRLLCVTIPDSVTEIGTKLFLSCQRNPFCIVTEGSYAREYCGKNEIPYRVAEPETSTEELKPEFPYRSGDFRYVVLRDKTAAIVKADTGTECVIPREVDGYTVTAVGLHGYYEWNEVYNDLGIEDMEGFGYRGVINPECTGIEIPDTVTTIGHLAMYDCKNLGSVSLPDGLKTIGSYAFAGTGLTSVKIPEGVTYIGSRAFKDCEQLTEAVIPGTLEIINSNAFESCGSLKDVTIAEGVRTIGKSAFAYCNSLRKVVLPGSLEEIKKYAFLFCDDMTCVVPAESYAQKYCEKKGIPYTIDK